MRYSSKDSDPMHPMLGSSRTSERRPAWFVWDAVEATSRTASYRLRFCASAVRIENTERPPIGTWFPWHKEPCLAACVRISRGAFGYAENIGRTVVRCP